MSLGDSPASATGDLEKGSFHHNNTSSSNLGFRPPIQLTPEQYERLFLQPGGKSSAANQRLAQTFGNPTPLGIISHLLAITPTACYLMGWGGTSAASLPAMVGAYYFIGGMGLVVSGVMEWIIGNTFPSVVFITFGGFWLSLGTLQDPLHNIASAFAGGAADVAYTSGLMFYFAFWSIACLVYLITSLRTNVVFVVIFFTLMMTFIFLSVAYAKLGSGDATLAVTFLKASGSFAWVCVVFAWYLEFALLFGSVEMPLNLPLGDLSGFLRKRN